MVGVVSGHGRTAAEVVAAVDLTRSALAASGCAVAGLVANRVEPADVDEVRVTLAESEVSVIPELALLTAPTVGETMAACDGGGHRRRRGRTASGRRSASSWRR